MPSDGKRTSASTRAVKDTETFAKTTPQRVLLEKSSPDTKSSKRRNQAKNRYVTTPDMKSTPSMAKTHLLSKDSTFVVPPSPMTDSLRRSAASSKQQNYINEDQVDYVNESQGEIQIQYMWRCSPGSCRPIDHLTTARGYRTIGRVVIAAVSCVPFDVA